MGEYADALGLSPAKKTAPAKKAAGGEYARALAGGDRRSSSDYQREKKKADRDFALVEKQANVLNQLTSVPVLPILDEVNAGLRAGGNEAWNVVRKARGERPVDSGAIYQAQMDADRESTARLNDRFPVSRSAGGLLAGIVGPGKANAVAKAPAAMTRALQAVGAGAGYGAAYGASDTQGADRLEKGLLGGLTGGAAGGALGATAEVAMPVVQRVAPVVADVTKRAVRKASGAKPAKGPTPEQIELGRRMALRKAEEAELTPDVVRSRAADEFRNKPVIGAELMGEPGVTSMAAAVRRSPELATTSNARLRQRAAEGQGRIMGDFEETLGLSPEFARGDVQAIIERQRTDVGPLWEKALGPEPGPGVPPAPGVWNDELASLFARKPVRDALASAKELEEGGFGRSWEGLHIGRVERPGGLQEAPAPLDEVNFGGAIPRGPAEPPSRGPSALTALRQTGEGITDELAGEAQQAGLRLGAREGGAELNDMAIRLHEGGFTPRVLDEDEIAQLLQSGEARKLFAREADTASQLRYERRASAEDMAEQGQREAPPNPEDYYGEGGPAPQFEPAYQTAPTARGWDLARRALNANIERDQFDRPITTGPNSAGNLAAMQVAKDLRRALAGDEARPGAIPHLNEPLEASSDYLAVESALKGMKGRLLNSTVNDFNTQWARAKTDAEKTAARAAIATDVLELFEKGQLKAGRFSVPGVQQKLDLAFGPKGAREFVKDIEVEAEMARRGNRMVSDTGSGSFSHLASDARNAADGGGAMDDLMDAGMSAVTGNAGGVLGAAKRAFSRSRDYLDTAAMDPAVLQEYGRVLGLEADEFADFLSVEQNRDVFERVLRDPTDARARQILQAMLAHAGPGSISGRVGAQAAGQVGAMNQQEPVY